MRMIRHQAVSGNGALVTYRHMDEYFTKLLMELRSQPSLLATLDTTGPMNGGMTAIVLALESREPAMPRFHGGRIASQLRAVQISVQSRSRLREKADGFAARFALFSVLLRARLRREGNCEAGLRFEFLDERAGGLLDFALAEQDAAAVGLAVGHDDEELDDA